MARTVLILATLDTKGEEAKYLKDIIEAKGYKIIHKTPKDVKIKENNRKITWLRLLEKARS